MPKAYPLEVRNDVIAAARVGDRTIAQVAKDHGMSESCIARWLALDDKKTAAASTTPNADPTVLREARKKIALLEQENHVLRQAAAYLSRGTLPK